MRPQRAMVIRIPIRETDHSEQRGQTDHQTRDPEACLLPTRRQIPNGKPDAYGEQHQIGECVVRQVNGPPPSKEPRPRT